MRQLRILHLEDSRIDAELVRATLADGGLDCEVVLAESQEQYRRELGRGDFDLVLADYTLPDYDGLAALALAAERLPETPFIFVSGTIGEDRAVETFKSGATDYVLKGHLSRLVPSIRRALQEQGERRERRRAEQELRSAVEAWDATFNAMNDAIIIIDADGKIGRCNAAMARLAGSEAGALLGRPCWQVVHGVEAPIPECPFSRMMRSRRRETATLPLLGRWFAIVADPVFAPSGEISGAVHIMTDVTESRQVDEQLRQAQKMEAVGQLTGGIAHDFNNILSAVLGYASMLEEGVREDARLKGFACQILMSVERAADLTRSLLTFSRKQVTEFAQVDLNDVLERVHGLLERVIGENIELRVEPSPERLPINADGGQLEQVLMNLATNARDAMPDGGVLTLRTELVEAAALDLVPPPAPGTRLAALTVTDTGTGMDATVREKIFEPFFTTKKVGRGTGLGLSIVYGIVRQHDGHIRCESAPGLGTTFRAYFPLLLSARPAAGPGATTAPEDLPRGTETILVAEDDALLRRLLRDILESYGYSVLEAADGDEAVARFRSHHDEVRLILCDVIMPRRGGAEVLEAVRGESPGVRFLLMSGYPGMPGSQPGAPEERAGFLQKPVHISTLLKSVREALDRPGPPATAD